jgi:hypothetical protein
MTELTKSSSDFIQTPNPVISFIQSQKGKLMMLADGYTFKLNKTTTTTKYWRCTLHECLSKIHTNLNNQLIKVVGEHDHPLEKEKIEIREFCEKVKERVKNETTPVPRIYDEECAKSMLTPSAIAMLPSEREMSKKILVLYYFYLTNLLGTF